MNIVERIFQESDRRAVALIGGGEQVTYGRLVELADAAATCISKVKGARIGLDCPNGIAHVVLALAILRTGKCLVPLASELAPDLVIASSTYPLDIWTAAAIARRAGARLVYEVHDLWPLTPVELHGVGEHWPAAVTTGAAVEPEIAMVARPPVLATFFQ